jgi:heat shock protein HslJ
VIPTTPEYEEAMRSLNNHPRRPLWAALIAGLMAALGLAGPAPAGDADTGDGPPLEGTQWSLQRLVSDDGQPIPLVANTGITIRFQGGRLQGGGGCNRYFAAYEVHDERLSIDRPGATMMACPQAVMDQERAFLGALEKAASYGIDAGRLTLADAGGRPLLSFSPQKTVALTGSPWQLISYHSGNALLSNRVTERISAVFGEDGRLQGSAGCNRYFATYETRGEEIQLGPVSSTRKICPESEEIMETETGYLAALGGAARFEIRDQHLTLFDAEHRRLAMFRVAPRQSRAPDPRWPKVGFDLSRLDAQGLYGPPDGLRALDYEFCIPATQAHMDKVRAIDPDIRIHRTSPGRIACTDHEYLCLGNTHEQAYREILRQLALLPYVTRIVQSHFE